MYGRPTRLKSLAHLRTCRSPRMWDGRTRPDWRRGGATQSPISHHAVRPAWRCPFSIARPQTRTPVVRRCAARSVRACEQRTPRCPIAVLGGPRLLRTDLYVVPTEPASRGPPVRFVYVAINAARPPRPPLRGRPGSLRDAMEIFDLGHLKPPRQARCQPLLHQPPKRSRRRFQAPVQSRSTSSYICAITG